MKNKVCCFSVFGLQGNFSLHETEGQCGMFLGGEAVWEIDMYLFCLYVWVHTDRLDYYMEWFFDLPWVVTLLGMRVNKQGCWLE